ncbi:hypothetical protein PISMIDRAFT_533841 [Pisolithus microcarpus 441]|uniref:Uncharacterized protein n=1 Tax=Pisolithus microcarpus 441 TaxID=765257 RepID=A0A0C9Z703_9AGAM|nr:hypothetical protein BKA83DRAFT_533841 [Pisolithus microcarpus]KIK21829.1 hypothetical protein PISMIDRAFT_533841 [Pisolithus microcarpus 441]
MTCVEIVSVNRFIWERHDNILCKAGFCSSGPGLIYKTIRAVRLPGTSIIPPRSTGRLPSSDGGDFVAVCWEHGNSGWKVVIDALTGYVTRRRIYVGDDRLVSRRHLWENGTGIHASDIEVRRRWHGDQRWR